MASSSEQEPRGMFECQLCGLTVPYSYVGQKPPNTRTVVLLSGPLQSEAGPGGRPKPSADVWLLEECYVLKDPFSSDKDKFLILGSQCSLCSKLVCVGPVFELVPGGSQRKYKPFDLGLQGEGGNEETCPTGPDLAQHKECSLFYSKRFCLPCVRENLSAFPQEIRQDVEKRHALSKTGSRKLASRTGL